MKAPRYYVYVVEADHAVKIGISQEGAYESTRRKALEQRGGYLLRFERLFLVDTRYEATDIEAIAHTALADCRTIGEWFHCHPFEAVDVVTREWNRLGYPRLTLDMVPQLRAEWLEMKAQQKLRKRRAA